MSDDRPCICHPDEAPMPCQKRYASSQCQLSALRAELAAALKALTDMAAASVPIAERDALRAELAAALERVKQLETALENDDGSLGSNRVAKLREALEPFARCVQKDGLDNNIVYPNIANTYDYLRARAVLEETKGDGDE